MTVSKADDGLERDADAIADRAMRMSPVEAPQRREAERNSRAESDGEAAGPFARRTTRSNTGNAPVGATAPTRQTHASPALPVAVSSSVGTVLRSPGEPLGAGIRDAFEPRFQADFSGVRIHSDSAAAVSAQAMGAAAYTYDRDIVFNRGLYAPHGETGQRLLAHELAHVQQQSARTPMLARQVEDSGAGGAPRSIGVFLYSESLSRYDGSEVIAEWPRHAFLRVTTEEGDYLVELGRDPDAGTERTADPLILPWAHTFELAPYRVHPGAIHRPTDPTADAHFEARILQLARSFQAADPETGDYVRLPDYSAFGPNSNGFVRHLVRSAGGTVDLDTWAFPGEGVTAPYSESPEAREARRARRVEENSYRYRR